MKKKMSILLAQDGFSFYIPDAAPLASEVFVKKEFTENLDPKNIPSQLEKTFAEHNVDFTEIDELEVIYSNNMFCFVPRTLFDKKHLADYLKFNTKIMDTDFIAFDELQNGAMNNVYIPYANINNYFFDKVGTFHFSHATSLLVDTVLRLEKQQQEMWVNVHSQHYDLAVVDHGKLIMCNSFSFSSPEDFVYYILFVAEQLKMDTEQFSLKFIGNISEADENFKFCYAYIRNCSLFEDEKFLKNTNDEHADFHSMKNYLLLNDHS